MGFPLVPIHRWMTLNGGYALYGSKDAYFRVRHKNEDRPILSAAKNVGRWSMFLQIHIICGYFRRFLGDGASNDSWVVDNDRFRYG